MNSKPRLDGQRVRASTEDKVSHLWIRSSLSQVICILC